MKILSIVGARPNFMKVAPLHRAFQAYPQIKSLIIHTGQHYDAKMSDVFFEQLELPKPDYYLGIGGGSHTQQKAKIMLAFEEICEKEQPDLVLVVGDVNSTAACSLVAVKMGIPVAHVEAGLRSGDRSMPEEINRLVTDAISNYLFVTEQSGMVNLAKENVADSKVFFCGNVMIDSLVFYRKKAAANSILIDLKLEKQGYVVMTMHRPANVDSENGLKNIVKIIENTVKNKKVVFAIHPRTANNLQKFGLYDSLISIKNLIITEPLGYLEFLNLMDNAFALITDSGGVQEETTFLGVPCFTFRDSTERPVTVDLGTNYLLADLNPLTVEQHFQQLLAGKQKPAVVPPLWDGRAAERIAAIISNIFIEKQ